MTKGSRNRSGLCRLREETRAPIRTTYHTVHSLVRAWKPKQVHQRCFYLLVGWRVVPQCVIVQALQNVVQERLAIGYALMSSEPGRKVVAALDFGYPVGLELFLQ